MGVFYHLRGNSVVANPPLPSPLPAGEGPPVASPPIPAPTPPPVVGVQLQPRYQGARLFLQPRADADRLTPVASGIPLRIIEARTGWLYIETPDERRGWILREWVQD